ncbi:MAG: TonB-dependent receptor domain-containing protein [Steroidobacteraceae bacterium]
MALCLLACPESRTLAQNATSAGTEPDPLTEVVVTGSYLQNVRQENMASPIVAIDEAQIAKLGVVALGDLTRYVPQNVGSVGGIQDLAKGGIDTRDARSANLRGLGSAATLVLLNGRRVVPYEGYVNLNSLTPTIAISRVETVLDGASATYGADAVAGVVNVITNNRFEGFQTTAQHTHVADSPEEQIQAMWGAHGERSRVVVAGSFTHIDNLQNADRSVTNFFNASGGSGAHPGSFALTARPQTPAGGDVIINGHNYSTLYDTYKAPNGTLTVVDPDCGSAATKSIFTPAAAGPGWGIGTCAFSFQAQNPIRPVSNNTLLHMDASYDLAEEQQVFLEGGYYRQDSNRYGVPSYAQNHNGATGPVVPASSPYNPFGVPVIYSGRAVGSEGFNGTYYNVQRDHVDQLQTVFGVKGRLRDSWHYTADLTWSQASVTHNDHDTDMNLYQAALSGYGGPNCNYRWNGPGVGATPGVGNCSYLSPFAKDDLTQNPALIYNIQADELSYNRINYLSGDAIVDGSLWHLPGGDIAAALGVQVRHEEQSARYSDLLQSGFGGFNGPSRDSGGSRTIKSVFTEWNFPIVENLNADIAVRHEDYGQFRTTDPKVAAMWRVVPWLSLRGSWSKAFQAPTLANSTASQISANVVNITDPVKGTTVFRSVLALGNPALQPQKANVYNLGLTLLPLDKSAISLDYWRYKYDNQIETQNPQAVINIDPAGSQVIRDQSGVAQTIYVLTFNAPSGTQTSGIDLDARFGFDWLGSRFTLRDTLSYLLKYDIDTGTLVYNGVGRRNNSTTSPLTAAAAPRYRDVLGIDWTRGGQTATATIRYVAGVEDDYNIAVAATTSARVASWTVCDLQYAYGFGADERYRVTLGMINAFNRSPPRAKYTGYLSSLADPYGRQSYIRVDARF